RAHRRGTPRDTVDRPLLVPLGVLPRAERRAVRASDPRARLRHRRGPRAPRRVADPAARVRASPAAGRTGADAAARPASGVGEVATGTEPLVARWRAAAGARGACL